MPFPPAIETLAFPLQEPKQVTSLVVSVVDKIDCSIIVVLAVV